MPEPGPALWARLLDFDLVSHAYWADHTILPGANLFYAAANAASSLAILGQVSARDADHLLEQIINFFTQRDATPRIWVTPLSEPSDWPQRLARYGFHEAGEREVYMMLRGALTRLPNPQVEVRRAPVAINLETFVQVQDAGFGVVGDSARNVEVARRNLDHDDWAFYVALLNGQPVGAATALYKEGIAGIWGVTALPESRRQGISTSLLHHIVDQARRLDCSLIYLSANPGSYARGLYSRLGFVEQFETRMFERTL